ncbi:MAG: glutamate-5-semialdehyde dehydrogenase [Spirochaetaceae bacterium]|nr:glutamate-5-semialdehyde dehydrogenase [Spirochaetaceae bacterium]
MELSQVFVSLREGAKRLSQLTASQKNLGLLAAASSIDKNRKSILDANAIDVELSRQKGVPESLVDRLSLDDKRIDGIIESIKIVAQSEDPIGSEVAGWKTPEGLTIRQVRVPLGVAAIIYESRPNVTADAFALAYKSGNSILLRGSSSALNSNRAIVKAIKEGLENAFDKNNVNQGVPEGIALADSGERSEVDTILTAKGFIDVVLPRGGANLIKMVVEKATVPVIETGSGVCHTFIDETADIQKAVLIAENAKLQRPGVCNAMETLLVHKNIAKEFLPELVKKFDNRAELRCCSESYQIINTLNLMKDDKLKLATEDDFGFEFLDNILAIKVVENIEQAILHINSHNTKHSEAIITQNISNAKKFQSEIDASSVYVNASTRFTDGGVFGFGAELGISTQKFHVRGPMGLTALTTTKYLIDGDGHTR